MAGKGFGFVEFETSRDAEDAVQAFNGKSFMGATIVVEFAKEARRREPRDDDRGSYGPPPRARRAPGFRIIVSGVSRDTSWQVRTVNIIPNAISIIMETALWRRHTYLYCFRGRPGLSTLCLPRTARGSDFCFSLGFEGLRPRGWKC